jgi:predicted GIY-YIG superfamily endonuclease
VLVWSRRVRTWSRALREEIRIKGLKRRDKEVLVAARSAGA